MSSPYCFLYFVLFFSLLPLVSCTSKPIDYQGITYPPTQEVKFTFQERAIPIECKVFSHGIVSTPVETTSLHIKNAISDDARHKGADLVFLGLARTLPQSKSPKTFVFRDFGPQREYLFKKNWAGWKFGFSQWSKGDELVSLGYDNYAASQLVYESGLMIKHVLLRCQPDAIKQQ